jgi:hypothetical protein
MDLRLAWEADDSLPYTLNRLPMIILVSQGKGLLLHAY